LLVLPELKFGFAKPPIELPSSHTCGKPYVGSRYCQMSIAINFSDLLSK
jgi:hypothetical protein